MIWAKSFFRLSCDVTFSICVNSADNFSLLDSLELHFVGSVKLTGHKELVQILNDDPVFVSPIEDELKGTKSFKVKKKVYGQERTLVVTYNQNLFNAQWLTLQNDISKSVQNLTRCSRN